MIRAREEKRAGRSGPVYRLLALFVLLAGCTEPGAPVRCGIDVALDLGFPELAGKRVGLITNATGRTMDGERTIDALQGSGVDLVRLFTPEHGLATELDEEFGDARDAATGLSIVSLYGEARRPSAEALADLDVLAFDVQDAGARFYTYLSTLTLALEAAATSAIAFVVYDRPNPIGGGIVEGPGRDPGRESFTAIHDVPVRHGMTLGELAHLVVNERGLDVELTVVSCAGWRRSMDFDATALPWRDPSPNLKSVDGAFLYPGLALWEFTNLSVGRGTKTPFEHVGAPWIDSAALVRDLQLQALPGVRVEVASFTPTHGPFAGERCNGARFRVVDRTALRAVSIGLALAHALRARHPEEWDLERVDALLTSKAIIAALVAGAELDALFSIADRDRDAFLTRRRPFLMYPR